jgi:predicted TPR repeat methyltransferase
MHDMSPQELLQAGREHVRAGRLLEAEALFRRAAGSDSPGTDALLNLGMVLHDLGRSVEAAEVLGKLVMVHPQFSAGWVQLAHVIALGGFDWEAHQAIARALKAKPNAQTLVAASMVLMMLEDKDAAESLARRAVKMSPQSASAWIQLGQILTIKGRTYDAAAAYQRALAEEPGNAVATFFLAALNAPGAANDPAPPAVAIAPPEYVRALFDGFAERFETSLVDSLKYRVPQLMEQMFAGHLRRGDAAPIKPLVMLDAGCGTGLCAQWMAAYRGSLAGVDLSRGMIARAQGRELYDELIVGDVVADLQRRPGTLDLIVAADVLVYFGDLSRLFAAAAAALRPGGVFLFSVEASAGADFLLLPTHRFAHSMNYLHRLAVCSALSIRTTEEVVVRMDKGSEVRGYLVLAEKSS